MFVPRARAFSNLRSARPAPSLSVWPMAACPFGRWPRFPRLAMLKKKQGKGAWIMSRKGYLGIAVFLLAMSVAVAAPAEPLRNAKVGDRMGSLVTGLTKVDGASLGSCANGAPVV